jgi:putative DNA primase/helicase
VLAPKEPANAYAILKLHKEWRGRLRLNGLTQQIELDGRAATDTDVTNLRNYLAARFGLELSSATVFEQAALVASENLFEPVQEYLRGLKWDGTARLETWAERFLGAALVNDDGDDVTGYVRAVSRRVLVSAVARALDPGCKVDTVLVLEGDQGEKKSTAFAVLGGAWFSDDLGNMDQGNKDAKMALSRVWIQELPELAALGRAEVEQIKSFISRRRDVFRPPFGRVIGERDRRCIFVGTTNETEGGYLKDRTGGRRFWPIRCTRKCDTRGLAAERDQIWAEAVSVYLASASCTECRDDDDGRCAAHRWWLTTSEEQVAKTEVAARTETEDAWAEVILEWWERKGRPPEVTGRVILEQALHIDPGQIRRPELIRVGQALRDAGFVRTALRRGVHRQKGFRPGIALITRAPAAAPTPAPVAAKEG